MIELDNAYAKAYDIIEGEVRGKFMTKKLLEDTKVRFNSLLEQFGSSIRIKEVQGNMLEKTLTFVPEE